MKPVLKEKHKEDSDTKMEGGQTVPNQTVSNWKIAAIFGIVAIILVAGATVIGVYVGKNLNDDAPKEAWVVLHDSRTNNVVKERYILQGHELSVIKPGEMTVIYDFSKNHVVMQIDEVKAVGTGDCLCMVYGMETDEALTLTQITAFLNQTYIETTQTLIVNHLTLVYTNKDMQPDSLSRRSLELCLGCKIAEMESKSTNGDGDQNWGSGNEHCVSNPNMGINCVPNGIRCG